MGRRRALLVHNSKFIDPSLAPLTAAKEDVRKLRDLLQQDYVGFQADEITLLENPSLADFRAAVSVFFKSAKQDDYLFFYYAGHGIRGMGGELYLALRNTTLENYEALALEASYIRRNLERCFAKQKVLLLDCCNASAFRQDGRYVARDSVHDAGQMVANFDPKGTGTYILGASQSGSSAYETKNDAGQSYSLFTHHLIEGVTTGKAAQGRDRINWADIGGYIHAQRNSEGVLTTPYIDMTNAAGLLEFCRNPCINPVLPAPPKPRKTNRKTMRWIATGLAASLICAGAYMVYTQNPPRISANALAKPATPPSAPITPNLKSKDSSLPAIPLTHSEICKSNPDLLVDLANPKIWALNNSTNQPLYSVQDKPEDWRGDWLSVAGDFGDALEFNIEFCSCSDVQAEARFNKISADDSAQIFLGGDDFAMQFDGAPTPLAVNQARLVDQGQGDRALTLVLENGVNGGAFGFSVQGELRALRSYLGQCRN